MWHKDIKYIVDENHLDSPRRVGDILLYQVGRRYCAPASEVATHFQGAYIELTVVTGGRGQVGTNGVFSNVQAGDIHIAFPGEYHAIISDLSEPLRYDYISLWTDEAPLCAAITDTVTEYRATTLRVIRDGRITSLISRAIAELSDGGSLSDAVMGAICTEVLVYVIRALNSSYPDSSLSAVRSSDSAVYMAMSYIDGHIFTLRSLTEVAEALGYSYNYLSNLFRGATGRTLMDYYRERRLDTARLLLGEGRSVASVAQLLGYSSVYSFSRAYKQHHGVSPGSDKSRRHD